MVQHSLGGENVKFTLLLKTKGGGGGEGMSRLTLISCFENTEQLF